MTLDSKTLVVVGGGVAAVLDFIVGQMKSTGRAKNVLHMIGIAIVAACGAIATALSDKKNDI